MKIHKQGYTIVAFSGITLAILIALTAKFIEIAYLAIPLIIVFLILYLLILWFFRNPNRIIDLDDKLIYAPADGKIVVIEPTIEQEYFNDERIQVSIFMSPLNVHINYYPIGGVIDYTKYHPGKYLVAWHPKSSTENERSTIVIKNGDTKILIRQIAGAVARRIITNAKTGEEVRQGDELGFIKFGSRVDIFLPKSVEIVAQLNQFSRAGKTILAKF